MLKSIFPRVGIINKDIKFHVYVELCLNFSNIATDYYADLNAYFDNINNRQTSCLQVGLFHITDLRLYSLLLKDENSPPIIFKLTNNDIPLAVRAMEQGAFDIIVRPIKEESLKRLIMNAINNQQNKEREVS